MGVISAFEVEGCWSISAFVGKHKCFESDACSYTKPVKGAQQWSGMKELEKDEDQSSSCILNQWQRLNVAQRQTCQE